MKPITELTTFLRGLGTLEAKEDFAKRCETTLGQLKQVAGGHRRCGESLAVNIERESGGAIRCETMRPDVDWGYLRGTARSAA
jgi:DNA-binding transcriptional regulator YdaS (Cro superfamily)